jgi:hypothetical protein
MVMAVGTRNVGQTGLPMAFGPEASLSTNFIKAL